jgi:hypothetical protein
MSLSVEDGALHIFYVGPSFFTPPRSQKGLRARNSESMITKQGIKVKLKKGPGNMMPRARAGQKP